MAEFTFTTSVTKARLDPYVLYSEGATLADQLASLMTGKVQIALLQHRKKVSGDTLRSVKWLRMQQSPTFQRRFVIGGAGFKFIVSGRAKGKKMPVQRIGEGPRGGAKFEPVPLLKRWFLLKGIPQNLWFPIMRKIAEQGIMPLHIPRIATVNARAEIRRYGIMAGGRIGRNIVKRVA